MKWNDDGKGRWTFLVPAAFRTNWESAAAEAAGQQYYRGYLQEVATMSKTLSLLLKSEYERIDR